MGHSLQIRVAIRVPEGISGKRDSSTAQGGEEVDDALFNIKGHLSPLHLAAKNDHLEIIQELLNCHKEYSSDYDRATALLLAVKGGHVEIVKELFKSGITRAFHDTGRNTALHIAVQERHHNIVDELLSKREILDINSKNEDRLTPLHCAVEVGCLIIVKTMLAKFRPNLKDLDKERRTVFHTASYLSNVPVFRELFTHSSLDDVRQHKALSSTDSSGHTPLTLAAIVGCYDIVEAIIDWCNFSSCKLESLQGRYLALTEASRSGSDRVARLLFEKGRVSVDAKCRKYDDTTALHYAPKAGNTALIELLLHYQANLNTLDVAKETPLHLAARGQRDAVRLLLDNEATNINLKNIHGMTPLWEASWFGKVGCVEELVGRPGVDIHAITVSRWEGWTALHAAHHSPEISALLLNAGANPMALNKDNIAPFMLAAKIPAGFEVIEHYI